jgi:hypothetical protein
MVQAAARGAVDFAEVGPRDFRWWRRLTMLCDAIEAESLVRLFEGYNRRDLAALAVQGLTRESFEGLQNAAANRLNEVRGLLLPWLKAERSDESLQDWAAKAREQWVREWGDPNSGETKARIAATVAALNRDNKALRRAA